MLYHLFTHLREIYDLPGAGLFSFVSFRAGMSLMTSLMVGILFGKRIIERLQLKQGDGRRDSRALLRRPLPKLKRILIHIHACTHSCVYACMQMRTV